MKRLHLMSFVFLLSVLCIIPIASAALQSPIIIDHSCTDIWQIPESAILEAKNTLHIAYGHTSHGSQLTSGMGSSGTQLDAFMTANGGAPGLYVWHDGPQTGALDLDNYFVSGDLGNPDRVTWAARTRDYLDNPNNADVNVVIWSWCGQVSGSESDINTYLSLMNQLEIDYPNVMFVYMTGHLDGSGESGNVNVRNNQIRDFCNANNKILYDFADIESYDPDGLVNYMELDANDNCDYDSDGDGSRDTNWATAWQNSHVEGVDWWASGAAHSQHLNGNRKGYAAWWLWATLSGWSQCIPAPSNLSAVPDSDALIIDLAWSDNSETLNEDAFIISRQVNGGDWDTDYASVGADVTSFTDNVAGPGTYSYRVAAFAADNGNNNSCYSITSNTAAGEIISLEPPEAPSDLNGTENSSGCFIDLTWADNSNNETAFVLARQFNGTWDDSFATVGPDTTSYTDSNLTPGTYVYSIKAVNQYGESLESNETAALTIINVPSAPTGLTANGDSITGAVTLNWTDNSDNEDEFIIQRQVDGGIWNNAFGSTNSNITMYLDDNQGAPPLANGTYNYRIIAVNSDGASDPSNESRAIISSAAPDAPSNLDSSLSGFDVTLTWIDNSDNEERFVLERQTDSNGFEVITDDIGPDTESFVDAGLQPLYIYTYRIKAINNFGESDTSNETEEFIAEESFPISLKQGVNGYTGCRDAYLESAHPTYNYGNDPYNYVPNDPKTNFVASFDLPQALKGKKILEATMGFYCWSVSSYAANQFLDLYKVTSSWEEGTANGAYQQGSVSWNVREGDSGGEIAWSTPGGDFDPQLLGQSLIPSSGYYPEFDITALVQEWVDGTTDNFGVLLKNDSTVRTGIKASEYSEYGRPYLNITYTSMSGCALTTSSTEGGFIAAPGEGTFTYDCGSIVELAATSEQGFEFVSWTGDVSDPDSATTTVTVDADKSVSANFIPVIVTCNLIISSTEGGSVTLPGEGTFTHECGTVVQLTATPEQGFEFVNWTGNVADPDSVITTVTVDADKTVSANFAPVIATCDLNVSSTQGGSVTVPGEGTFTFDCGIVARLMAVPEEGYEFAGWSGDVADPDSATTTISMDGSKSISASFVEIIINFDLAISSTEGGSVVTPGEGTFTYTQGIVVELAASADEGFEFVNWTGDVSNPDSAAATIAMSENKSISANFAAVVVPELAAHYKFNNDYTDTSGNDNHGVNYGSVFSSGKINQAAAFDGINDYVSADNSDSLDITNDITLSAWIYYEVQNDRYSTVISKMATGAGWKYSCFAMGIRSNRVRYGTDGGGKLSTQILEPGNWYHLVMTHVGGYSSLYINGNLDSSATDSFTRSSEQPLIIGARKFGTRRVGEYTGLVDDVRIYNLAISDDTIWDLFELAPISPVMDLVVTAGDGQASLNWVNPQDSDFAGVLIIRSSGPEDGFSYAVGNSIGENTVVYKGADTSFIDTGLTNGKNYHYQVFAFSTDGTYSGSVATDAVPGD